MMMMSLLEYGWRESYWLTLMAQGELNEDLVPGRQGRNLDRRVYSSCNSCTLADLHHTIN